MISVPFELEQVELEILIPGIPLPEKSQKECRLTRGFQIMGITKRGEHCLKAIYLNLSELNIKSLIKYSRSAADKLIEMKKPPENFFISPRGTQNIN